MGCGDEQSEEGGGSGEATSEWSDYCIAVVNEEVSVKDSFGDEWFTAKSGSQYIISTLSSSSTDRAELLYLTSTVQESFDVDPATFMIDCTEDNSEDVYVAFVDRIVYGEESLETELRAIAKRASTQSSGSGFSIAGEFSLSRPQIYELSLGGFAEQCGDVRDGFVSVPEAKVAGSTTWLLPLATALRPIGEQ